MARKIGKWVAVTAKDLKNFNPLSVQACAYARALKRAFPNKSVRVGGGGFYLDELYYEFVNKALAEYHKIFEAQAELRPIEFYVPVPRRLTPLQVSRFRLLRKKAA